MNRRQAGSNTEPAVRAQIGRAFAQTVRSLRCEVGISQERLALGVGINRAHLAGLERGVHTPTLYTMCRLLPGLHVTFCRVMPDVRTHPEAVSTAVEKAAALPSPRLAAARIDREAFPALNTYPPLATQPGAFKSCRPNCRSKSLLPNCFRIALSNRSTKHPIRQGGGSIATEGVAERLSFPRCKGQAFYPFLAFHPAGLASPLTGRVFRFLFQQDGLAAVVS